MRAAFEKWFAETYPDDAAAIKMYDEKSIAVSHLDVLIPKRKYAWSLAAWQAAHERCAMLARKRGFLTVEDDILEDE
jgi:hypothetical protein